MRHEAAATSLLQVRQMFQSLSVDDRKLQIQLGLDASGTGSGFVARSITSYTPADQSVQVRSRMLL